MQISLLTDELSADLETALELSTEWGIKHFELRGIGTERIGMLSHYTEDHLYQTVERFEASVVALSPGLFKIPFVDAKVPEASQVLRWWDVEEYYSRRNAAQRLEDHLHKVLPNSIEIAKRLGAKVIVSFGIVRPNESVNSECPSIVIELLREAADIASKAGITLALENEHVCFADSAINTVRMIEKVGHSNLKINWDPVNSFYSGEDPYPTGYQFIKDYVAHVHFKDVVRLEDGEYRCVVDGAIDWSNQIRELKRAGYDGSITIETHCRPKIQSTKRMLNRLRKLLDEA